MKIRLLGRPIAEANMEMQLFCHDIPVNTRVHFHQKNTVMNDHKYETYCSAINNL